VAEILEKGVSWVLIDSWYKMKVSFYIYDVEDATAMHDTQFYKNSQYSMST